jgi:hypothetical protein
MRLDNKFKKKADLDIIFKSKYEEENPKQEEECSDPELFGLEIIIGTPPTEENPYNISSPASFVADMVKRGANTAGVLSVANKLGFAKKKVKLLLEARGMTLPKKAEPIEAEEMEPEEEQEAQNAAAELLGEPVKRKRGRPKKIVPEEIEVKVEDDEEEPEEEPAELDKELKQLEKDQENVDPE